MRRVLLMIGLLLAPLAAGAAEPALPDAAGRTEIMAVIEEQVAAFRKDDAEAAFSLASPDIQGKFGDAATFLSMVASAYMPIYRPRTFEFLELKAVDGQLVQSALVVGPDGAAMIALYPMVRIDGRWRINGCLLIPPPGTAI